MKEGLVWYLRDYADLVALLPGKTSIASFPAGQNLSYPFVTVQRINSLPQPTHAAPRDYLVETWQFDVYADTDQEAESIADKVRDRMDVTSRQFTRTYTIWSSNVLSIDDAIEMDDDGSQTYAARKIVQVQIKRARTL